MNTATKYANVAALVPSTENFDSQAVNEGVWLSVQHLENIEASLAGQNVVTQNLQIQLDAATTATQTATTALATANEALQLQSTEIIALKAEVARLAAAPAVILEETAKPADDHGQGVSVWPLTSVDAEKARLNKFFK